MAENDVQTNDTTTAATENDQQGAANPTTNNEPEIRPDTPAPGIDTPQKTDIDLNRLGLLNDVSVMLTIEIGRVEIKIRDLLSLTKGSIVELDKLAGEPVGVYANNKLIASGNIITANGKYCVRLLSVCDKPAGGDEANGK